MFQFHLRFSVATAEFVVAADAIGNINAISETKCMTFIFIVVLQLLVNFKTSLLINNTCNSVDGYFAKWNSRSQQPEKASLYTLSEMHVHYVKLDSLHTMWALIETAMSFTKYIPMYRYNLRTDTPQYCTILLCNFFSFKATYKYVAQFSFTGWLSTLYILNSAAADIYILMLTNIVSKAKILKYCGH